MHKFIGLLSFIVVSLAPVNARAEIANLDILANWIPAILTKDQAIDECWTNIQDAKNVAELSLRRAFSEVGIISESLIIDLYKRNEKFYYVEIGLNAGRLNDGYCIGAYNLTAYLFESVLGSYRKVILFERGGIAGNSSNLNETVRSNVQSYLDELALEVLRYRSKQN